MANPKNALPVPPEPTTQPPDEGKGTNFILGMGNTLFFNLNDPQLFRLRRGVAPLRAGIPLPVPPRFSGAPLSGKVTNSVLNGQGQIVPSQSGIVQKGNLPIGISTVPFTATSGGPSSGLMFIAFSWPAFPIRRADGTSTIIPVGTQYVGKLNASTQYFFYPFWSDVFGAMGWANGGVGNPAIAFTAQSDQQVAVQNQLSNHPLSSGAGLTYTTPAGGGTSSGTGGYTGNSGLTGCPIRGTKVDCLGDGVGTVEHVPADDWIYVSTEDGHKLIATPDHPVFSVKRGKTPLNALIAGELIITDAGESAVRTLEHMHREDMKLVISLKRGHLYWAGGILSHNIKQKET